jgi:hypothetical protein
MFEVAREPTPMSLLNQRKERATPASEESWRRFVKLCTPLLLLWARRVGAEP